MKRILLLFVLITSIFLEAKESPSFNDIKNMPTSYAKDYYTWRFILEKKTSKKKALEAYKWTKRKSSKLKKAIQKKLGYTPKINSKNSKKKQ